MKTTTFENEHEWMGPKTRSLDLSHSALAYQFTVLYKFPFQVPPIIANQVGSNNQNASDWFATKKINLKKKNCHVLPVENLSNSSRVLKLVYTVNWWWTPFYCISTLRSVSVTTPNLLQLLQTWLTVTSYHCLPRQLDELTKSYVARVNSAIRCLQFVVLRLEAPAASVLLVFFALLFVVFFWAPL